MNDDIDQLLTQLRLKPLREIVERELTRAQKAKPSYAEFWFSERFGGSAAASP